jgi:hypothetical protein
MCDLFADAQAWYDRAQKHIDEYSNLMNRPIFTLNSNRKVDGNFVYSIRFNRGLLVEMKPVACETANALFQSLDNIIAIAARQKDVKRSPQISWPWAIEPVPNSSLKGAMQPAICSRLKKLRKNGISKPWLALIRETFEEAAIGLSHIDIVKEISISGKHWELVPTKANALAIAWTHRASSQQIISNIPADHFDFCEEYIFHEGEEIDNHYFEMATSFQLVVADKALEPEPITALGYTARFVANALKKARQLQGPEPLPQTLALMPTLP